MCVGLGFFWSHYTRDMDIGSLLAHLDFYKISKIKFSKCECFCFSIKTGERALKMCNLSFEQY